MGGGSALPGDQGLCRGGKAPPVKGRINTHTCIRKSLNESEHLDNSIPHGITGKIRDGMKIELSHEIRAVSFRSLYTEVEGYCYFFAGFALGEQLDHFALARGEPVGNVRSLIFLVLVIVPVQVSIEHHSAHFGGEKSSVVLQG